MSWLSMNTPFGPLTLFTEGDTLIAVEWGRGAPPPDGPTPPVLLEAKAQLDAYFDGRLQHFDLPLAASPTAFQTRVRTALQAIPYGRTRSYGDLAHDLDTAPRAVGTACARNPLPIVVPCHRVLGARGLIGGYTGGEGLETKHALLRLEGIDL